MPVARKWNDILDDNQPHRGRLSGIPRLTEFLRCDMFHINMWNTREHFQREPLKFCHQPFAIISSRGTLLISPDSIRENGDSFVKLRW